MLVARPVPALGKAPRLVEPVKPIGMRRPQPRMAAQITPDTNVAALLRAQEERSAGVAPASTTVTMARVRTVSVLPLAAPVSAPLPVAPPPANDPKGARAPSTLQAQAQRLALRRSIMPPASASRDGALAVAAAPKGNLQIQIGAFGAQADALKQLQIARDSAGALLGQAGFATPVVTVKGRTYYRARFTGFDAAEAAKACHALRRHRFDCLVARAE